MDNKIYKNSDYHQNSIERLSQEEKDKKQIIKSNHQNLINKIMKILEI